MPFPLDEEDDNTRVKHLNPRQGITTCEGERLTFEATVGRVKHLNPRQGITTGFGRQRMHSSVLPPILCETPKSPPGDYNVGVILASNPSNQRLMCETPKSPPGDYNGILG